MILRLGEDCCAVRTPARVLSACTISISYSHFAAAIIHMHMGILYKVYAILYKVAPYFIKSLLIINGTDENIPFS